MQPWLTSGKRTGKPPRPGAAVPAKTLAVFTRQLAVMIGAGVPLVQCLDALAAEEPVRNFASTLRAVRSDVEGGAGLAGAMRRHPRAFDSLYAGIVEAGEAGGELHTMLERLADYIEKRVALTAQVRSATAYPIAVLSIAAVVVGIILWQVIPTFEALFDGLGAVLPLPTRIVIAVSGSFVIIAPVAALGLPAGAWLLRRYYATPSGRRVIDGTLLRVPVLGGVLRRVAVARFCRTLSTLLGAGVPILDGLELTAGTAGNAVVADAVRRTRAAIERGRPVAAPLAGSRVFPPIVVQMVGVGEATGTLDSMLARVADFYEQEVDTAVAGLTSLLEPVMMAVLGIIVGGIVVAMYLPVFDLISRLAR